MCTPFDEVCRTGAITVASASAQNGPDCSSFASRFIKNGLIKYVQGYVTITVPGNVYVRTRIWGGDREKSRAHYEIFALSVNSWPVAEVRLQIWIASSFDSLCWSFDERSYFVFMRRRCKYSASLQVIVC